MEAAPLPPLFERLAGIGVELQFSVFENVDGDPQSAVAAIGAMLAGVGEDMDAALLTELGGRRISEATFLGDWVDPATRALIQRGTWTAKDGRKRVDPVLTTLEGEAFGGLASGIPPMGSGGQFAYAFLCPPFGLQASPVEIQSLFDGLLAFLLPPGQASEITDWSCPELYDVSSYFSAGLEWWGVFLFTIWQPGSRRLIVIGASTTD